MNLINIRVADIYRAIINGRATSSLDIENNND